MSKQTVKVDRDTLRILAVAARDAIRLYRELYGLDSGAETEVDHYRRKALEALGLEDGGRDR